MLQLDLARWQKLWLNRPWEIHGDAATGMIEVNGVRGYLVPGDIEYLFNLAKALPAGGNYLEVGSWMGLSSIVVANGLIANLNFRATIYCIDTWCGSPEHQALPEVQQDLLYQRFKENIADAQVDGLIQPVRGASIEAARTWTGPLLDLIFIDGDHSTEACYQDICHWMPKLKPSGRVLGHDAIPGGEVELALRRYCGETRLRASICPLPQSHFIWELQQENGEVPLGHRWLE